MTGDINGFLVIGALWFVLTLITRAKGPNRPRRPGPPSFPPPTPLASRQDPTQQEGVRLQRMLGDLRRVLEEAAQTSSPSDEPVARPRQVRSKSLQPSEARSLEGEREPVDLDDEAAGIEARRIQAAIERNAGRKPEAKPPTAALIRQEPADHTSAPRYTARQLRDAVVWREILDPPLGLRNEREG
jgi:hypothetical protein